MAKKKIDKTDNKGEFEIFGFEIAIPKESFDKLLQAMSEPKKKKRSSNKKATRNDG